MTSNPTHRCRLPVRFALAAALLLISTIGSASDEPVLLNAGAIDLAHPRVVSASAAPLAGKRLHLVQFHDAVRPDWIAQLEKTGVEIITYIPNNAYLVYGDVAAIAKIRSLAASAPFIRAEGEYAAAYKVQPVVHASSQKPNGGDLFAVQLVQDAPANAATLQFIDSVKLAPVASQIRILHYLDIFVRLPASALAGLSRRPDVVSIRRFVLPTKLDERQDQIVAGNITGNVPTAPGYLSWLASKGFAQSQFDASGFAVDVTDSGIDDGTTSPNHFALFVNGTIGGTSRVMYNRLVGTPNMNSTIAGCDGHGTLDAHIIGGYDDFATAPHTDASGFHYGLGVAPFARLGSSVIFDPRLYTFPDFPTLQSSAYHDGARISSNSWGSVDGGAYDVVAQIFDALTRDAQPPGSPFATAGNQEMVMVFAAGNSGPATQTIASPAVAKNVIAVGAEEGVQAFGAADLCGITDAQADSANDVASLSSRGPAEDGRRKPELVAPGTHISGGLIQSTTPGTTGQADACFTGSDVCGGPTSAFFPNGQQFFTASSGTSHAAPAVAGAAALLRQWFINAALAPPTPAMTRAYLVNAARYLTGDPSDARWSVAQGMGGVDLGRAFDNVPRILRDEVPSDVFTATGQTRTVTGTISDSSKPLRVTLAWTDAPGSTIAPAYNNNLDLTVTIGGTTYRGNVFSGANSVPGGSADAVNNLESVFLPAGLSGAFAITVTAANINSDGVPNSGGVLDQDFALVAYNAVESAAAVIGNGGSQLAVEGCAPGNLAIDPGETVTVNFGLQNVGTTATTNLIATLLPSAAIQNPGPPQSYGSVAPGTVASQPIVFTAQGSCGGTFNATLQLQDNGNDLGLVTFTFSLGANSGSSASFSNSGSIAIPDAGGIATPYPSTINVSNVTGTVTKVTVTLNNFSHTFPDEVDVLLVGPLGQNVMLMSDCGEGLDVVNAQLTFDDAAPFPLPNGPGIVSGTYKPVDYEANPMPSPAPAGTLWGAQLSTFNGLNPNGAWKLYVNDDTPGDGGSISGGWTITITTSNPVCCVGPGTLQLSAPAYSITEGPAGARITITRTNGADGPVGITLSTSDGTAHAGSDYIATTETVTWASGDAAPKVVIVPQLDDTIDEDDETFNVQLSNVTGGASIGANASGVVTIVDNDPPPVLSVNDVSIVEGDAGQSTVTFTLSLSAVSARLISVAWATADGTATAGSDYVAAAGTMQFNPGETTHTIGITINGDTASELDETFFLNLTSAVNTTLSRPQATATIISDDLAVGSIVPASGPAAGGTNVTIGGAAFANGASLTIGGSSATNVVVANRTQITATTPPLSAGTLNDVTVTNANSVTATFARGYMADFFDVPQSNPFHNAVEKIFRRGITAGCGNGNYCPDAPIARSQMAVFLLKAEHGQAYAPPPATGTIFTDVPANAFAAAYIEQLFNEGITGGCAANPRRYCPDDAVTRAQMSVFLLVTSHGSGYTPPAATGIFGDVPTTSPFARWIEALYNQGITAGCSANPLLYCPDQNVLRGQMAAFVSTTFP